MDNSNDTGGQSFEMVDNREFEALSTIVKALQGLPADARPRVLASVTTFLGMSGLQVAMPRSNGAERSPEGARFSEDRAPSPKDFLFEKRPNTDVDRVACLAYYLTHYRDTPHFKTLDLSKLNTEAAQLKFSNAAQAVDNAAKSGFLVPAHKGAKQLSAMGELYVQALPDRNAARESVAHARPKKRGRRGPKFAVPKSGPDDE